MCDRIAIIDSGRVVACEDKAVLMQRIDSKSVVIWPEHDLDAVPESLHSHGDLDARLRDDGALVITYPKSHMRLGEILAAAQSAGITVKDLTTEEADLEDVFVAMTGGRA
jgi:ABC-2 type transport system ATP-binding protein